MKHLLDDSEGYKTFVEVNKIENPSGLLFLTVYTVYEKSQDPDYQQHKFGICLTADQVRKLGIFLIEGEKSG